MNDEPRVYALFGVPPEIQAFGLAKFSRSADPLDVSIQQIGEQKAGKFLEDFYFQYGHASIADLAHIAIAIENVSHIAALEVTGTAFFDGPWDGQESSTRYQDWSKRGFVLPEEIQDAAHKELFHQTANMLLGEYEYFRDRFFELLLRKYPKPEEMKQNVYERTLRARALDSARYILFLGTRTGLGQIISYRTLEKQIARFLSSPIIEVQNLGQALKKMCKDSACWPASKEAKSLLEQLESLSGPGQTEIIGGLKELFEDVQVAPTLVKYANPKPYLVKTYLVLREVAQEIFAGEPIWEDIPQVTLIAPVSLEEELVSTLLYRVTHYPFLQVQERVARLRPRQKEKIKKLALKMDPHDEGIPELKSGYSLIFDILMDIGAMRDIHRHRRCIQILQDFTTCHGFEFPQYFNKLSPEDQGRYCEALRSAQRAASQIEDLYPYAAQYLLPFGFRCRFLLKCDYEEVRYLTILRSGIKGNLSYRRVAWLIFRAFEEKHPSLAKLFAKRVVPPEVGEPLIR